MLDHVEIDRPLRLAVVGARCRNQGIGAHLARFCAEAGTEVVGLLGSAAQTTAEASRTLEAATGQRARAYTTIQDLVESERPDALVIASPHETHARFLDAALDAGLHVLCEKPLVWGADDPAEQALRLSRRFLDAGLHLRVNAQWPYTLPAYRELFPSALEAQPRQFSMHMSPRSHGVAMLLDALPHPLSLLTAVLPDENARLEDIQVTFGDEEREAAHVRFVYAAAGGRIDARVDLQRCRKQPRPAGYGFDGRVAARRVEMPPYRFFFEDGERRIPLPDPTPLLVGSFLDAVAAGPPQGMDPAATPGMRLLAEIVTAAQAADEPQRES